MRLIVVGIPLFLTACSHYNLSFSPDSNYARKGAYVGAGISLVDENFTAFDETAHDADEVKPGVNLKAGYRFFERLASEITFQNYYPFDVTIANAKDGTIKGAGWTINLKYFFATGNVQPYIFAGAGYGKTDNTSGIGAKGDDTLGTGGIGVDVYLNLNLLIFFEAASYKFYGDTSKFGFRPLTTGLQYRF